MNETFSITFGDQAENHVGMQKIGVAIASGFSVRELQNVEAQNKELINLTNQLPMELREGNEAAILIIRGGIANADSILAELKRLNYDKKAKMRGRVVNKSARWNLCLSDFEQEADYEEGKGRVVNFAQIPECNKLRISLPGLLGAKADQLQGEINYYYDVSSCGIGFHGDAERKIVVCARLGASMPLVYQWYQRSCPVGQPVRLMLNHGDLYVMSEKATGCDWRKKIICTLRHAAGAEKYLLPKKPKESKKE